PAGEVSDVQIPDAVVAALKDIAAGAGGAGLGDMFSKEGLQKLFGQNFLLPKGAVNKGDSWQHKLDMKTPLGKQEVNTTYQYNGPTQKDGKTLEQIGLKVQINIVPDPAAIATVKIKDQNSNGTILFDNEAGRLLEMNLTQTTVMDTTVAGKNIA